MNRLLAWMEARPWHFLLPVGAIFLLVSCWQAAHRPFWSDELFAWHLAEQPSFDAIWSYIQRGIELNPPLWFWISWWVHHSAGAGHLATRLPSILGFGMGLLCVYFIVHRLAGGRSAMLACAIPLLTFVPHHALDARCYGMLFGFSALAVLCWVRGWRAGLALSLMLVMSLHYYGMYLIGALLLGEWVRRRERRGNFLDTAAILAGVLPLLAWRPLLAGVSQGARTFWSGPTVEGFYEVYAGLITPGLIVLIPAALAFLTTPPTQAEPDGPNRPPRDILAVCTALLLMPVVFFVASFVAPVGFYARYFTWTGLGFAILFPWFLNPRMKDLVCRVGLVYGGLWLLLQAGLGVAARDPASQVREHLAIPDSSMRVVYAHESETLQALHYLARPGSTLCGLYDVDAAAQYLGFDTAERSLSIAAEFAGLPLYPYARFVRENPVFVLVVADQRSWLPAKLRADGAELRLKDVRREPGYWQPREQRVYEVRMRQPQSDSGSVSPVVQ